MDIHELLTNKLQENQKLEYKKYSFKDGKFNSLEQKQRSAFLKEICSFANAEGGTLVVGIGEDDNHNPIAASDVGVNKDTWEMWEQSFRSFCKTKIRPVLHGIACTLVEYNDEFLITIDIPKSILKPHAFYDGNRDEFYIRYGNMCNHMSYDDLKRSFTELESIQSKISSFRDNRLAMLLNGEIFGDFENETILVLHIIPHWSIGLSNYIDINSINREAVKQDNSFDVFSPTSRGSSRRGNLSFNTDGMLVSYGERRETPVMSYSQLFHNGAIESVEVRLMNYHNQYHPEEKFVYDWYTMEKMIHQRISSYCNLQEKAGVPKPYNVFVSILNAKGKRAILNEFGDLSEPLPRDIIKSIPAYISEDSSFDEALRPLFTSLANSFGMEKSINFK